MTFLFVGAISFVLSILGSILLGYRTSNNEQTPPVPLHVVLQELRALTQQMMHDLGFSFVLVILAWTLAGIPLFLLSLLPYSWLKKFSS